MSRNQSQPIFGSKPINTNQRGQWGSKLGFILAAAGSAIGLGNIWRFPIEAANNGGAAFLLVYLVCFILIGLPVMLAELCIGRFSQKNPIGAFRQALPRSFWWLVGALSVLTGLVILSYYSVVAGWTLGYVVKSIAHTFQSGIPPDQIRSVFGEFTGDWLTQIGLHLVFMLLCVLVVVGGVRSGIERWSKILMPTLFLMLLMLMLRSITLPGSSEGLRFYLYPDFSKIDLRTIVAALGQTFFSMSLGMGAMITYGSYLSKRDNLVSSTVWIGSMDTAIAFLSGLIILPALAVIGHTPGVEEGGAGLIFQVLPKVFTEMPWQPIGGIVFAAAFFFLLLVAGVTSGVSLLEVVTSYLIDERGWSRKKSVWTVGGTGFLIGIPSALGCGAVGWFSALIEIDGAILNFMDLMHTIFGRLSLTIGALLTCLSIGWIWGIGKAKEEIMHGYPGFGTLGKIWSFLLRFLCPLAITVILIFLLVDPSAIR